MSLLSIEFVIHGLYSLNQFFRILVSDPLPEGIELELVAPLA